MAAPIHFPSRHRKADALGQIIALNAAAEYLAKADLSAPEVQLALSSLGRSRHLMRLLLLVRLAHHDQVQRFLSPESDTSPAASAAFAEAL